MLEFLNILFLKGDKQVARSVSQYNNEFLDFLKIEQDRFDSLAEDFKPSRLFANYIFSVLVPLVHSYLMKLAVDTNEPALYKKIMDSIEHFVHALAGKYFALSVEIVKD